jgi:DNA-binding NarL/FixJ family response regulator
MTNPVTRVTAHVALSRQQLAIMQDLVNGYTPKEIALRLRLQHATIRAYMARVRAKLNTPTMYQCVALVVKHGMVQPPVLRESWTKLDDEAD